MQVTTEQVAKLDMLANEIVDALEDIDGSLSDDKYEFPDPTRIRNAADAMASAWIQIGIDRDNAAYEAEQGPGDNSAHNGGWPSLPSYPSATGRDADIDDIPF